MKKIITILLTFTCISCIEVDKRDDAVRPAMINLLQSGKLNIMDSNGNLLTKGKMGFLSLLPGEKFLIMIEYFNQFGVKATTTINWTIAVPSTASISSNEITALAAGTTFISGSVGEVHISINLTVVSNANAVASVIIATPAKTSLAINETVQLTASVKNIGGAELSGKAIEWFTENSNFATVSATGLVTALTNGSVEIHAKSEGVKSNSIKFNIGTVAGQRAGTFQSAGGYSASGSVTATESGNNVAIQLSPDFSASVALGTYIYLANSTSGSTVKSAGLELGQWTPTGTKSYSAAGVTLNQYKYVVVLCKPAGVIFGFAELKP